MLPPRNADTMSEAIALSSPNGHMSKRARNAANDRLSKAIFGPQCTKEDICGTNPPTNPKVQLLAHAARLRNLAARGMSTRKFIKEAEKIEKQAQELPE